MKILFTGGGTVGHISPIIAITREVKKIYQKRDIAKLPISPKGEREKLYFYYLGPEDEFAKALLSKEEIKTKTILTGKIRRYLGWKSFFSNLIDVLFKIPLGILQAFFYLFWLSPDLIFSKGGYGSIPAVISGWILRVPIFLHESDIVPGLSNRFLSRFASEIFVSFPGTKYLSPQKMILVGNPIRTEIMEGKREEAKKLFQLAGRKPVILILGGSQGSQRINDRIIEILPDLLKSFEVLHQCGKKNFKQVQAEAKLVVAEDLRRYYHLFSFLKEEELKQAYAVADLIVSRAGSGTIFEIAGVGKPAILIPLEEAAQNHQLKNAYFYAKSGAGLVIEEANFTPHFFLGKLNYLFSHPEILKNMADKAKQFAKPRATEIIAEYIVEYLCLSPYQ